MRRAAGRRAAGRDAGLSRAAAVESAAAGRSETAFLVSQAWLLLTCLARAVRSVEWPTPRVFGTPLRLCC